MSKLQADLSAALSLALADPLDTSGDLVREANANLFCWSLDTELTSSLTIINLQNWYDQVVAGKRAQLRRQRGDKYPLVFYGWVDAQAGQLRHSLVAAHHAASLPFRCVVRIADRAAVLQEFLDLEHYGFIPWEDLTETTEAASVPDEPFVLNVWTTLLP